MFQLACYRSIAGQPCSSHNLLGVFTIWSSPMKASDWFPINTHKLYKVWYWDKTGRTFTNIRRHFHTIQETIGSTGNIFLVTWKTSRSPMSMAAMLHARRMLGQNMMPLVEVGVSWVDKNVKVWRSLVRMKLPTHLRMNDLKQGIIKECQNALPVIGKCARDTETTASFALQTCPWRGK